VSNGTNTGGVPGVTTGACIITIGIGGGVVGKGGSCTTVPAYAVLDASSAIKYFIFSLLK